MLDIDDVETYTLLLQVCQRYHLDPSSSLAAEDFFRELLAQYSGSADTASVVQWLDKQVPYHFPAIKERPRWLQNPEWPFMGAKPMIFAGQIDVTKSSQKGALNVFHDDTSLYVFVGHKIPPVVIVQQL